MPRFVSVQEFLPPFLEPVPVLYKLGDAWQLETGQIRDARITVSVNGFGGEDILEIQSWEDLEHNSIDVQYWFALPEFPNLPEVVDWDMLDDE